MCIPRAQEYADIVACVQALRAQDAAALCALLQRLPARAPRVVPVLILRYGLEDGHPPTLRAIGMVLEMGSLRGMGRVQGRLRHGYVPLHHPVRWAP